MEEIASSFDDVVYLSGQYFVLHNTADGYRRIPCRNKQHADQVLAEQRALRAMSLDAAIAVKCPNN